MPETSFPIGVIAVDSAATDEAFAAVRARALGTMTLAHFGAKRGFDAPKSVRERLGPKARRIAFGRA